MVWSCRKGSSVRVYWCTVATRDVLNVEFASGLPQRYRFVCLFISPLYLSVRPGVHFSFLSCLGVPKIHGIYYGIIVFDI